MAVIMSYVVRAPLTLATSQTAQTAWVPCRGALQVVFKWKCALSSVGPPASQDVVWQNNVPIVTTATGGSAASGNLMTTTTNSNFMVPGGLRQIVAPLSSSSVPSPARYISVEGVRAHMVNGATAAMDNLECTADVYYEDTSMVPTGSTTVA